MLLNPKEREKGDVLSTHSFSRKSRGWRNEWDAVPALGQAAGGAEMYEPESKAQ